MVVRYRSGGGGEAEEVEIQCSRLGVVQVVKEMRNEKRDKGVVRRGEVQGSVVGRYARMAHQKGVNEREWTID